MCTVVILRRPEAGWPLILGANRDEMISRPWDPPARYWSDRPDVVAGRDRLAGGSWLGVNDAGVVAAILNRHGTLGPAAGFRSRGELVLEALDHADAAAAARGLRDLDPKAYRAFNMVIADNRDAFWLRHADPTGTLALTATPIAAGLSILTAGDLNDAESSRIRRYRPRFEAAAAPDPERGDFSAWEALLADASFPPDEGPNAAMRFETPSGFATVSSAVIALRAAGARELPWRFRFATWLPEPKQWQEVIG